MALTKEQYEYIDESILDTFEATGTKTFPIDVFELCKKLKIRVIKYSKHQNVPTNFSDDAYSFYNKEKQEYIIVYNDSIKTARVAFTIMHEIGHIQLDHHRRKLTESEQEREADIFAQKALAPVGIILRLGLQTDTQISSVFKISLQCAGVIVSYLESISKKPYICLKEINSPITALFEESINAYINQ